MSFPITKRRVISSLIEDGQPPSDFTNARMGVSGRPRKLDVSQLEDLDTPEPTPPAPKPEPTIIQPTPITKPSPSDVPVLRATPITIPKPAPEPPVEDESETEEAAPTPRSVRARHSADAWAQKVRAKKEKLAPVPEEDEPEEPKQGWFDKLKNNKLLVAAGVVGLLVLTGNRGGAGAPAVKAPTNLWE